MQTTYSSLRPQLRTYRTALLGVALVTSFMMFGSTAHAASLEYSGWIPWWQADEGIESASRHLRDLSTIYPFVYEVNALGGLVAKSDLTDRDWEDLIEDAQDRDIAVIPTVAWFNGVAIDAVLSDRRARADHIEAIVEMVEEGDFDGVNIDYESKLAKTKNDFSTFLEELKDELGRKKTLTCTIEARTPPSSRYREVPATLEYANDYKAMAKHCDHVEIMAYDQQRIDWRLNDERSGQPYIPVADAAWVEKVVVEAMKDIPAEKIVLGVPTYGRQWTIQVAPNWYKEYTSVGAINLPDAEELAEEYDVEIGRNKAGEASFTFFPESSIFKVLNQLPVPAGTPKGNEAAAKALLFANASGMTVPVNIVWYSDARAIEDKIDLAKKYDLKGVALFKIDGEEDQDVWDLF